MEIRERDQALREHGSLVPTTPEVHLHSCLPQFGYLHFQYSCTHQIPNCFSYTASNWVLSVTKKRTLTITRSRKKVLFSVELGFIFHFSNAITLFMARKENPLHVEKNVE